MGLSGGGGCCDCGDSEAWKAHPNCRLHGGGGAHGAGQVASSDLLARIPEDVRTRARLVFRSVLKYAYDLFTTETNMNPPADLTFRDSCDRLTGLDALDSGEVADQVRQTPSRPNKYPCTNRSNVLSTPVLCSITAP